MARAGEGGPDSHFCELADGAMIDADADAREPRCFCERLLRLALLLLLKLALSESGPPKCTLTAEGAAARRPMLRPSGSLGASGGPRAPCGDGVGEGGGDGGCTARSISALRTTSSVAEQTDAFREATLSVRGRIRSSVVNEYASRGRPGASPLRFESDDEGCARGEEEAAADSFAPECMSVWPLPLRRGELFFDVFR
jgi:hypothetical protein